MLAVLAFAIAFLACLVARLVSPTWPGALLIWPGAAVALAFASRRGPLWALPAAAGAAAWAWFESMAPMLSATAFFASLAGPIATVHLIRRLRDWQPAHYRLDYSLRFAMAVILVAAPIDALIAADKARIALPFDRAAAIDLAGRDVLDAVKVSVNPRVIQTPDVSAVAKDGIELIATARITVRANLERLVGGAGEETIIARVGEGVVSSIGSTSSHKGVLENPDIISKTVLAKGLDSGTAFEILSIDIADVNVGRNIGAQLQTDQAEADKRVAQAKAEERRAMAVAEEQENSARVEAMRAKVVEAEAEVPLAIAEAFRSGNIGVMDYYQLQNIQSDTTMRGNIARAAGEEDGA